MKVLKTEMMGMEIQDHAEPCLRLPQDQTGWQEWVSFREGFLGFHRAENAWRSVSLGSRDL